jgi:hypothetical protein
MGFGATTKTILDCCDVEYPKNHLLPFSETGLSIIHQHLVRARYYVNKHVPPANQYDVLGINPDFGAYQIAKLILLKKEVYPKWSTNAFQFQYLVDWSEELDQEERCSICGLIQGGYCNETCPNSPTPKDSSSGQSSYNRKRRSRNRKSNTSKTFRKRQYHSRGKGTPATD